MEHLESMNRLIEVQLKEIERQLKAAGREKADLERREKLVTVGKEVQSLESQLALLDMQLVTATDRQREIFVEKVAAYAVRKDQLSAELGELQRKLGPGLGAFAEGGGGEPGEEGNERQQLVENVDRRLQDADVDLDDIINDLNKGKNIMNEVAVELKRQQEKLAKAVEEIKDTYSIAKQSKVLLRYFQKALMTDKILIAFIILVIIAIIVIIVLKSLGFKADSDSPTTLPS